MAAEWLRADEVAAIVARRQAIQTVWNRGQFADAYHDRIALETQLISQDLPALCEQDARWRALVGGLTPVLEAAESLVRVTFASDNPEAFLRARRALNVACEQARAALDGAPGAG